MRVLLRDCQTGLYYGKESMWVEDVAEALAFTTLAAAAQQAAHWDWDHINVVLRYEEPVCELAINPAYCGPVGPGESSRAWVRT